MMTLQNQITQSLEGLSDDSLRFILDMIQRFVMPADSKRMGADYDSAPQEKKHRIGSMKGQKFIADGHGIDECNDEIAEMFGVIETPEHKALKNLQRLHKQSDVEIDYKAELAKAREEKYADID